MKINKIIKIFIISYLIIFAVCRNSGISNKEKEKYKNQLNEIANQINNDFIPIRNEVKNLSKFIEYLYEIQNNIKCYNGEIYDVSKDGVMYKIRDDGKSAVFVSGIVPINDEIRKIVCFTEPLDTFFIRSQKQIPAIAQLYYNDKHSYNRIYPFFDVLTQYEPKMNIPEFNFYYLADLMHNPNKNPVWVNEPYVDPAGRGWMISAIAPVYYKNELVGVPGIDVTINQITDKYFSNKNQDIIIVDATGVVVSANEQFINLFNLPPLYNHKYFETIKQDTYKKEDYNLMFSKNKEIRNVFTKILKQNSSLEIVNIDEEKYFIFVSEIKELKWFVVKIVKK